MPLRNPSTASRRFRAIWFIHSPSLEPRLGDPSYFFATSSRYHRRIVSGVASVATGPAPESLPEHRESSPLRIGEADAPAAELLAEHLDLLTLVLDQLLLVAAETHANPRRQELHRQ